MLTICLNDYWDIVKGTYSHIKIGAMMRFAPGSGACYVCLFWDFLKKKMAVAEHPSITCTVHSSTKTQVRSEITQGTSKPLATSMNISLPYCIGYLPIFTLEFSRLSSHEILRHHFAFLFLAFSQNDFSIQHIQTM